MMRILLLPLDPILVDEDEDPKEEEFEEEEEPQKEEDDMEVDIEEDDNEPELTYPYEEVDPLNPLPPPISNLVPDHRENSDGFCVQWSHEEDIKLSFFGSDGFFRILSYARKEIMPPKSAPLTQAVVPRMIKESVDAAIVAERARHANVRNDDSGYGPARGLETVNQMPWTKMKQLMTVEFCPVEEIQRMEHELWNLKVKEYNIVTYTQRFNELALICPRMVQPESVKIDAYIRGLTDNINGEVTPSRPTNLNEAVILGTDVQRKSSKRKLKKFVAELMLLRMSFMDTRFSSMLDVEPVKINASYEVELADGRVVSTNTVLKGCTLNLVNHHFEINLMPIELGTFDVIIGMDWLVKRDAVIVCGEKVVRIPYGNKTLTVESDKGMSRRKVISCIKACKYVERGCHLFLAHVAEKKPKEKRLEYVPDHVRTTRI
ncbi:putative reverse transcriptase domain-containing protein [Tanacetum coccineum]